MHNRLRLSLDSGLCFLSTKWKVFQDPTARGFDFHPLAVPTLPGAGTVLSSEPVDESCTRHSPEEAAVDWREGWEGEQGDHPRWKRSNNTTVQ